MNPPATYPCSCSFGLEPTYIDPPPLALRYDSLQRNPKRQSALQTDVEVILLLPTLVYETFMYYLCLALRASQGAKDRSASYGGGMGGWLVAFMRPASGMMNLLNSSRDASRITTDLP